MPYNDAEQNKARCKAYYHAVRKGEITPKRGKGCLRAGDPMKCDHCKKEFYRSPANRLRNGECQYCSRNCMAKAFVGRISPRRKEWISKPCLHCSTPVNRPKWATKNRTMTFCNRKCFARWKAANWKGQNNPCWRGGTKQYNYGPNWTRQSRRARARDGKLCQFCMNKTVLHRNLDVHHIRPFVFFGLSNYKRANLLANLVTLCPRCHHSIEKLCITGMYGDWHSLLAAALATPHRAKWAAAVHTHPLTQTLHQTESAAPPS